MSSSTVSTEQERWIKVATSSADRIKKEIREAEGHLTLYCTTAAPLDAKGKRRKPLLRVRGPIVEGLRTLLTRSERLEAGLRKMIWEEGARAGGQGLSAEIAKEAVVRLQPVLDAAKEAHWWALQAVKAMKMGIGEGDAMDVAEFIASVEGDMIAVRQGKKEAIRRAKREALFQMKRKRKAKELDARRARRRQDPIGAYRLGDALRRAGIQ